jgi:hypothetical protein
VVQVLLTDQVQFLAVFRQLVAVEVEQQEVTELLADQAVEHRKMVQVIELVAQEMQQKEVMVVIQ